MKTVLLAAVAALVLAAEAQAAKSLDPRVCSEYATHTAQLCARDSARTAMRSFGEKLTRTPFNVMVTCTGNQAWLRWRCTFRNGEGRGTAVVTFNPATFKPAVTMTLVCTPQAPLVGASPPPTLYGCDSTVPAT